ncbi:MAG: copper resistance system multicopper oxidase, partial [Betaproteobacteria bacterium]|nr:copper resistance system multicopper oxidase [Betaproteobacteria bacterium]
MKRIHSPRAGAAWLPRRRFVQGIAAAGVLTGLAPFADRARAQAPQGTPVLSGTRFDLTVARSPVNFTGAARMATTINGSIPAPTLRWREGETVSLRVANRLDEPTSIHWHGIILPHQMDGVPGLSFPGIAPGETFDYRFKVEQAGTYWYHSHSGFQEQTGMYGAIVIDPARGESIRAERDYVVHLSDWTDEDPMRVLAKLKTQGDYYNFNEPTVGGFLREVSAEGWRRAVDKRRMWNEMRMSPTDLADISAYTYTYLMNGAAPAGNWTGIFRPGERVRLRFINGGAGTFFDVRIPGLQLTVVQVDGQNVEPVTVDEFRFGPGETYDVVVAPKDDAYTIFAQSMDRTGYARGTLAPRAGMQAPVPARDQPEWLTMADMMGDMGGMSHAGMDQGAHAMHGAAPATPAATAMDHGAHAAHGASAAPAGASRRVRHARSEYGPSVDMRVDTPRVNLDDPGIGRRGNGRRALTYADLRTLGGPLDERGAEREIELHLTGNMERYTWSFDGLEFGKSSPVHLRY